MKSGSSRWRAIAKSEFAWEQEALDFVRERLPDADPCRAWSNFEFIADDGSINEVDLLVLTAAGFFLVEIKSWPGVVRGDTATWEWGEGGRTRFVDNPLLLTNRKAKKLKSLLERQPGARRARVPWIEPLVFLSHRDVQPDLPYSLMGSVFKRDRDARANKTARAGIVARMTEAGEGRRGGLIDRSVARCIEQALDQAGVRQSRKQRRVGDHRLLENIGDGPGYQDWLGEHVSLGEKVRIRIYLVQDAENRAERTTIERAARREYQILRDVEHPGILRARQFTETDRGPALVFDHDPEARRLDHFLKERGDDLGFDDRLALLRRLTEALRFAHEKRLFHRALSPASVLVRGTSSGDFDLKIFNWQTAAREIESTSDPAGGTLTRHIDRLVDDSLEVYFAPEHRQLDSTGEGFDVFGLGAVAFTIFAGRPPAEDLAERLAHLQAHDGLDLGAAVDGVTPVLRDLVLLATHPGVSSRLVSVSDFYEMLDDVEDELSRPDEEEVAEPTKAGKGDLLRGGFRVQRRLGTGSTAIAYLVEHEGGTHVLKLAREPRLNPTIEDEAGVLESLRHERIAAFHGRVDVDGHAGLLLAHADKGTLAKVIKDEGKLSIDLLERYGADLLRALISLEEHGVSHRDIKPENLGVMSGTRKQRYHLVLFDFSLARGPIDDIRVGTLAYRDPFLELASRRRWDPAADRYSAALVLHEMASGTLPVFGDGKSDPAHTDSEATITSDAFDAALRDALTAFFAQALRRDTSERFDTAEEMLTAWRRLFAALDQRDREDRPADRDAQRTALASATLDTSLATLGLSARAVNALERAGVARIRELIGIPFSRIRLLRGVGQKTQQELFAFVRHAEDRFPDAFAAGGAADAASPAGDPERGDEPDRRASIDVLRRALVPPFDPATDSPATKTDRNALLGLFGLESVADTAWPSQREVADAIGVSAARVSQALVRARERLRAHPGFTGVRDEIHELLDSNAGVMTAPEIERAIAASRGSVDDTPLRARAVAAVVRAAIEVEVDSTDGGPRWLVRRAGARVLVCSETVPGAEERGAQLGDWALRLGQRADKLAACDPIASPARVVDELRAIEAPDGIRPTDARRVRLAVEASERAALSSRGEIYPRAMAAARALRLSLSALIGLRQLTVEQLESRVRSRYPDAEPLPDRPALDRLVGALDLGFAFDPSAADGAGAYRAGPSQHLPFASSGTSFRRYSTATHRGPATTPDQREARSFAERLARAMDEGSFLALTVDPRRAAIAKAKLARLDLDAFDVDAAFIAALRTESDALGIEWSVVVDADAAEPGSEDRTNLERLAGQAAARVEREIARLAAERTVLLERPGLLARYDAISMLERLRDRVGVRTAGAEAPLHGVWVLVPSDERRGGVWLDDKNVPLITPGQGARIPEPWLENQENRGDPDGEAVA